MPPTRGPAVAAPGVRTADPRPHALPRCSAPNPAEPSSRRRRLRAGVPERAYHQPCNCHITLRMRRKMHLGATSLSLAGWAFAALMLTVLAYALAGMIG